jgi:U3 small nucleolar RNA-associated protein 25
VFERIDLEGGKGIGGDAAVAEVESRLEWFTKKVVITVRTVQSSADDCSDHSCTSPLGCIKAKYHCYHPLVFRLCSRNQPPPQVRHCHIRCDLRVGIRLLVQECDELTATRYSSNSEISRARTLFFKGKKAFLLVTERFQFYRRYRLRGAKTIVFYGPPDHARFYADFLHTPFIQSQKGEGGEVEVDEGEVSSRVLFSRFDVLRLERVVGSTDARRMLISEEGRFEFI